MVNVGVRYGAVEVKVHFKNKVNFLNSTSGTGKSFLFTILGEYYSDKGVSFVLVNAGSIPKNNIELEEKILGIVKDSQIICLDNADLYLTNNLYNNILRSCADSTLLISMHRTVRLHSEEKDVGFYTIIYEDDKLVSRSQK